MIDQSGPANHTDPTTPPQEHMPWLVVCLLSSTQIVSWGSIFYSFTLFLEPWSRTHGWTISQLAAGFSIALAVASLLSIPVGRGIDKGYGQYFLTGGSLLAALLLVMLVFVKSLWLYYVIWVGFGVVIATTFYDPLFAVLISSMPQQGRRAVTIATLFGGFASTIFIPLTNGVMQAYGWQAALVVLALINLLYCVPVHFFCARSLIVRKHKEQGSVSQTQSLSDYPVRDAMRFSSYWLLGLTFTLHAVSFASVPVFLLPLLEDRGLPLSVGVLIFTFIGPSQVAGRLIMTSTDGKVPIFVVAILSFFAVSGAFLILLNGSNSLLNLIFFAIVYGAANGILTIVRAISVPEFLGRKDYGAVQGSLTAATMAVLAAAPFLMALVVESRFGFQAINVIWLATMVLASVAYGFAALYAPLRRKKG